jgi:uncharacterized membrane protein
LGALIVEITKREIKNGAFIGLKGMFLRSVLVVVLSLLCLLILRGSAFWLIKIPPYFKVLVFFLFSAFEEIVLISVFCWHYSKIVLQSKGRVSVPKLIGLGFFLTIRLLIFGVLFFMPSSILNLSVLTIKLSGRFISSDIIMFLLDAITVILALLGGLFLIFFMTRYMLCTAVISENQSLSVRASAKMSVKMMKNEKSGAFCFILSLFPYIFLSLLIIPAFYFLPKSVSSLCLYQKYIIEKNRISFPMLSYK